MFSTNYSYNRCLEARVPAADHYKLPNLIGYLNLHGTRIIFSGLMNN